MWPTRPVHFAPYTPEGCLNFEDRYPDLKPLIRGTSIANLERVIRTAAMLRISHYSQLNAVSDQVATKTKLPQLVSLGYLSSPEDYWFHVTKKGLAFLIDRGDKPDIFPENIAPKDDHARVVSEVVFRISRKRAREKIGFWPLYKSFNKDENQKETWFTPDAVMVEWQDKRQRLTFLEVEKPKGNWSQWIADKEENYKALGGKRWLWDKCWRNWSAKLGLPFCDEESFCFSVVYEKQP